ncbi:HelD family protein [Marinicrinis lubricantis]|uniref:HelD family protein n=1 Tax=Marinicrinis lubricantis TaxID=2086470 RepID=A0ABW1ILG1_9BACL
MLDAAFSDEQERLEQTRKEIDKQLSSIGPRYFGDDYTEQVLDAIREEQRMRLTALSAEPYFGRIDFQEPDQDQPKRLYIGKHGLEDTETGDPRIIDWRAPVASLFYSFTGGDQPVIYDSPDGEIEGTIHLKRNLAVRQGELLRVVDSYVRGGENLDVRDEFLLYKLGEKKDNRLRDIVSTIQAEQDRIIRAPRNKALIIQGVAGSGKTTVALHRLAYLIYQYQEQVRAERMVIFAPNTMFLDYISDVLPELGVGGIQQTTFTAWALEQIQDEIHLTKEETQLSHWFKPDRIRPISNQVPGRFKGSLRYKRWLDSCLKVYEKNSTPMENLEIWDGKVLAASEIRRWYDEEYRHYPLAKRRERVIARIKRWMEMELSSQTLTNPKEKRKLARQRFSSYVKKWPEPTPLSVYGWCYGYGMGKVRISESEPMYQKLPEKLVSWTRKRLERGKADAEDLTALAYISLKLYGRKGNMLDHIVIDEAQDVSPFQIALLKQFMREPSFTILGDVAQGIHEYKGIRGWGEFTELFEPEQLSFHQLLQSYRSTTEIIEFANRVLKHAGDEMPAAVPVFRSGEPVRVTEYAAHPERLEQIIEFLEACRAFDSIAVMGRTLEECREIHAELTAGGWEPVLIDGNETKYRGGLSVLPVYLSKGLEFDAALLLDVDEAHYPATTQNAKLLYVGCTRALHKLHLLYAGTPSTLLQ